MPNDERRQGGIILPVGAAKPEVVSMEKRLYELGGLAIETNGTPSQVLSTQNAAFGPWHRSAAALTMAVVLELEKRDAKVKKLESELERLRGHYGELANKVRGMERRTVPGARPGGDPQGGERP